MDEIKLTLNPTVAAPEAATAVAAAEEAISEAETIVQQVQADTVNVQQFSDAALKNVKTKDLGEVGDAIADLVTELRGFDADEE